MRAALRWEIGDSTAATLSWDYDDLNQFARPAIGVVPSRRTRPSWRIRRIPTRT